MSRPLRFIHRREINLSDKQLRSAMAIAAETGLSVSEVIRAALDDYLTHSVPPVGRDKTWVANDR